MENKCNLFSSRGLLKSCCMHAEDLERKGPHVLTYKVDKDNIKQRKTPSIYINMASLEFFCNNILPKVAAPIVLITGDSDIPLPNSKFNVTFIKRLLSHPMIKRWYCQNLCYETDNLHPLPIGMDYHTLSFMERWGEKKASSMAQEEQLVSIKDKSKPFWERKIQCYVNFKGCIKHEDGTLVEYADIRQEAIDRIDPNLSFIDVKKVSRSESWTRQTEYAFVVSPPGNGLDCHRTWEALNLGCIPIIIRVKFTAESEWQFSCYDELPVLIVDKWEDITQDLLDKTITEFREKEFNYDKLTLKYWVDEVHK